MPHITPADKPRSHNRIKILLLHTARYAMDGPAKLARDIGVSRSTISRIMTGGNAPSPKMSQAIAEAISNALKRRIEQEDVFSPDGFYDEPSTCKLAGCRGCTDERMFDRNGRVKSEYAHVNPGDWTRFPERPKGTIPKPS